MSEIGDPRTMFQVSGSGLLIRNAPADIRQCLSTTGHCLRRDRAGGSSVVCTERPLFRDLGSIVDEDLIEVPWGLVPVLAMLVDRPVPDEVLPALLELPEPMRCLGVDIPLAQQLARSRSLTICHGNSVRPSAIIAQAAMAFPESPIIVSISNREEVLQIVRELRQAGIRAMSVYEPGHSDFQATVVVGPPLSHGYYNHLATMIFTVGRRTALLKIGIVPITHSPHARQFLLLPKSTRLAPSEWDRVHALFGFSELVLPEIGLRQREVTVLWRRFRDRQLVINGEQSALHLKQNGIQLNKHRNQSIAKVAKLLAGDTLAGCSQTPPPPRLAAIRASTGIVVLVEGIDHATQLAKYLPGWQLVAHEEFLRAELHEWERQVLSEPATFSTAKLRLIVTASGAGHVPWNAIDVVVRADGGVGAPPFRPEDLVVPAHCNRPLHLVDFRDGHHQGLCRNTLSRQKAYEELGWFHVGRDSAHERARLFVKRRRREIAHE
jgi:hypothetical protein